MSAPHTQTAGPGRVLGRWTFHVVFVACWVLIALMALLTWGPHLSRYKTEIIVGQSMEPTIPLWSVIVVEPVDPTELRKGDVIVAEPAMLQGRKVTHRVIEVDSTDDGRPKLRTQGDNNETADPWTITYAGDGYRVVRHVPHVGWIMAKAQTRVARLFLVVLPVLLILTQVLRWIWRDERPHPQVAALDEEWYLDEEPELDDWRAPAA